jgi:hypothetical protein
MSTINRAALLGCELIAGILGMASDVRQRAEAVELHLVHEVRMIERLRESE